MEMKVKPRLGDDRMIMIRCPKCHRLEPYGLNQIKNHQLECLWCDQVMDLGNYDVELNLSSLASPSYEVH